MSFFCCTIFYNLSIHKEQQEHIEKAIFSVLRNYSEEDLQMVMKLMDDVEQVWQELPW